MKCLMFLVFAIMTVASVNGEEYKSQNFTKNMFEKVKIEYPTNEVIEAKSNITTMLKDIIVLDKILKVEKKKLKDGSEGYSVDPHNGIWKDTMTEAERAKMNLFVKEQRDKINKIMTEFHKLSSAITALNRKYELSKWLIDEKQRIKRMNGIND